MAKAAPPQESMQDKRQQVKIHKVKVEVDRITRDEPETDIISGVTHLEVNYNGDLLLYQEASRSNIPSVGYASSTWISFEIMYNEED